MTISNTVVKNGVHVVEDDITFMDKVTAHTAGAYGYMEETLKSVCTDIGDGIRECVLAIGKWSIVVRFTESKAAICIKKNGTVAYTHVSDACGSVWQWLCKQWDKIVNVFKKEEK